MIHGLPSIALRSVRTRRASFAATAVTVGLGTGIVGSFVSLLQSTGHHTSSTDTQTIRTVATVVGGWGALIVAFGVVSCLTIAARERDAEMVSLRLAGARPDQVRRLMRTETLAVSVLSVIPGVILAALGGRGLLWLMRSSGVVAQRVHYRGGALTLIPAALAMTAVAVAAAGVAGRRVTKGTALGGRRAAEASGRRLPKWRIALGVVCFVHAGSMAVMTMTSHSKDPNDAMSMSGSLCIVAALGFAALAPALLPVLAGVVRRLVRGGAAWELAALDAARRPGQQTSVIAPVAVLTATAAGVMTLVTVNAGSHGVTTSGDRAVNLLNNVVTAMIVVFAAVIVVAAFIGRRALRRQEDAQLRLLGQTGPQAAELHRSEAWMVAGIGVGMGLIASLFTIVPFSVARHHGPVPVAALWILPLVAVGAAGITRGAAGWAGRRPAAAAA